MQLTRRQNEKQRRQQRVARPLGGDRIFGHTAWRLQEGRPAWRLAVSPSPQCPRATDRLQQAAARRRLVFGLRGVANQDRRAWGSYSSLAVIGLWLCALPECRRRRGRGRGRQRTRMRRGRGRAVDADVPWTRTAADADVPWMRTCRGRGHGSDADASGRRSGRQRTRTQLGRGRAKSRADADCHGRGRATDADATRTRAFCP